MNPRPTSVTPLPDYRLLITFQNGERRVFDAKPLLHSPLYAALQNKAFFQTAQADGMCVFWNDEIDLCPDTCYLDSTPA